MHNIIIIQKLERSSFKNIADIWCRETAVHNMQKNEEK
jgi:hypothetical protein